uniref:BRI1 kinase inhibitor 1 n=1 Tax=Kalanchoe fedtschenkoi TaxID=63787 RepID=A0A7N0UV61_KALFE
MTMEANQQSGGSTPKTSDEHPYEQLKTPNSVSFPSSPSHEFSFALPTQPNAPFSTDHLAVDLSPADDIFYGHLLPLHLFPHLHISTRSSTNSLDSFTLPATEFVPFAEVAEPKSKPFTFFKRWRKCSEETEKKRTQRKCRFELSRLLKRYARLVRPLLIFSEGRRNKSDKFKPQPISYSGNLSFRAKQELRGRSGEYSDSYSAPPSIRTSPVSSRILLRTAQKVPSPVADSTVEELQSAIQAAIAHCKNTIAADGHCQP